MPLRSSRPPQGTALEAKLDMTEHLITFENSDLGELLAFLEVGSSDSGSHAAEGHG